MEHAASTDSKVANGHRRVIAAVDKVDAPSQHVAEEEVADEEVPAVQKEELSLQHRSHFLAQSVFCLIGMS
jgi:hypothetical protein